MSGPRPRSETEVGSTANSQANLNNVNIKYNTPFNVLRNSFITKKNARSNNTLKRSYNVLQKGRRHGLIHTYAEERVGKETPYNFLTRRPSLWQGKRHQNFFSRARSEHEVSSNETLRNELKAAPGGKRSRTRKSRK